MTTSRKYARQPGADQVAAWKNALATRRRQQRRNRFTRKAPAITGIRIPAPPDSEGQHDGADTTRSA